MARIVRTAAAQLGPADEDKASNITRIVALIKQAKVLGVEFIVFPELALTPYFAVQVHDDFEKYFEEEIPSSLTKPIFEAAKEANIAFVLPYAEKSPNGYFNSAVIVDRDGMILTKYQKMHIPGSAEPGSGVVGLERMYFNDGELGFPVVDSSVGKVGMMICADRGFPESWRILGVKGAEIVITPFNSSVREPQNRDTGSSLADEEREFHEIRLRGSAIINQYFVVAPGKAGFERNIEYIGNSLIITPKGKVLARTITYGDELAIADIDLDVVTRLHTNNKNLLRRRPEVYTELIQPIKK